ncbi:MAG: hypothetical protein HY077_11175 [Elusimicrobia bacterium]|nr:hypothetical protein [Elusimicrobiota bacterium]
MRRGFCLIAVALAACGKAGPQMDSQMALYLEPGKLFSCQAPAQWRVLEDQGGAQRVTFLGPPGGPAPFSAAITIYYYSKTGSSYATPQAYAKAEARLPGKTTPLVFKPWKGLAVYEFSAERSRPVMHGAGQTEARRELTVLIPAPEGFYAAALSAPEAGFDPAESVFRGLVESLNFGGTK